MTKMSTSLDMSLDDIISKSKRSGGQTGNFRGRGRGRGSGSGSGPGPDRRGPIRHSIRVKPYPIPLPQAEIWPQPRMPMGELNTEEGTKLYISNLEYGVSNEDIKVLFSDVGDLKRYSIHYDRSGRSKGTAEVVFTRKTDALAAVARYNNVHLDGKPMKIELVGVNLVTPAPVPPISSSMVGRPNGAFRSGQERVGARGWARGRGGGRGSARGHGRGRHGAGKVSAEDLDAELEKYHLEALKIN